INLPSCPFSRPVRAKVFFPSAPCAREEAGMARRPGAASAMGKAAKQILTARWGFHPTSAAGMGLHRYDGRLPSYSPAALKRRAAQIRKQLAGLDAIARRGGLPPDAALELGVLRGMLLSEQFDHSD